jgi:phage gpG-like protein
VIRLELNVPALGDNPLARLQRRLPTALGQSLEQALEDGLETARQALGQRGTPGGGGRLAASLAQRSSGWGLSLEGELYSDLPYAGVQEYGALIQAVRAKYLRFQVEGRWVQVRRVTVPARPFLAPGAEAAAQALEGYLTSALMEDTP